MMTSTLNLYGSSITNNQLFFDDMIIVLIPSLLMVCTCPISNNLTQNRPTDDLFDPVILSSLCGQIVLCVIFFYTNLLTAVHQSWYCSVKSASKHLDAAFLPIEPLKGSENYPCFPIDPKLDTYSGFLQRSYENTIIWQFSHFHFAIVAFSITCISQFRLPFWKNFYFTIYFGALVVFLLFLILHTNNSQAVLPGPEEYPTWLDKVFNIQTNIPLAFRLYQTGLVILHAGLSFLWESKIVNEFLPKYLSYSNYYLKRDQKRDQEQGLRSNQDLEAQALILRKNSDIDN